MLFQQDSALRAVEAFPWALLETQLRLGGEHFSGWEMGPRQGVSVRAMGEAALQPPVLLLLMLCSWPLSNGRALPTSSGFTCFFVFLKAKAHEALKLSKGS